MGSMQLVKQFGDTRVIAIEIHHLYNLSSCERRLQLITLGANVTDCHT